MFLQMGKRRGGVKGGGESREGRGSRER